MSQRDNKRPSASSTTKLLLKANSSQTAGSVNPLLDNCHDYTALSLPLPITEDVMDEFPPLPVSPSQSPAPKKALHSKVDSVDIVETLSKLINERMDDLDQKNCGLCMWRDKRCQMQSGHFETENLQRGRAYDQLRITDLQRYSRRWNLRLFGVKEEQQEDTWRVAVEICQAVFPECKNQLYDTNDTVHRVGSKRPNNISPRPIIIQFISRRTRESLWKAAKTSPFLKDNRDLKFAEDLSWEESKRRSKLWPARRLAEKIKRPVTSDAGVC